MFEQFIGTKPVEQKLGFDVAGLEHYFRSHITDLKGLLQIEQFKGGQSNPTYRAHRADGQQYVLRRKPPGKLLPSAHAVEREYRVITRLAQHRLPGRADVRAVRGRGGHRPRVLRHGVRRRPRAVGPVAAGHDARASAPRSTTR